MARRTKKEKPLNLRLASVFLTHYVTDRISNASPTYTFLEPFPIRDAHIAGRFFDRCFGDPEGCALASAQWALWDRMVMYSSQARNSVNRDLPLPEPLETKDLGHTLKHAQFDIDGVCLSMTLPSAYLGTRYAKLLHNMDVEETREGQFRRLRHDASDEDRHLAANIRAWVHGAAHRWREANDAVRFIQRILPFADGTAAFFKALPGMRGVALSLGVPQTVIDEADRPYVGHNTFNTLYADARLGMWRTVWADEHRPTLLKLAAAKHAASTETNYIPDRMFVHQHALSA